MAIITLRSTCLDSIMFEYNLSKWKGENKYDVLSVVVWCVECVCVDDFFIFYEIFYYYFYYLNYIGELTENCVCMLRVWEVKFGVVNNNGYISVVLRTQFTFCKLALSQNHLACAKLQNVTKGLCHKGLSNSVNTERERGTRRSNFWP